MKSQTLSKSKNKLYIEDGKPNRRSGRKVLERHNWNLTSFSIPNDGEECKEILTKKTFS